MILVFFACQNTGIGVNLSKIDLIFSFILL